MFQLLKMNMGKLFRITVGILILTVCLQVSSLPIPESNINVMQKHVECESVSTFYTPQNLERECMSSALHCFMRELNGTVKAECKDPFEYVDDAVWVYNIELTKWQNEGFPLSTSSRCTCELWPETPFDEFLERLKSLFQLQERYRQMG